MAEFIMKKMARTEGVTEWFDIASAATSNEEAGNPVYPMARLELAEHGIGCMGKTSRQFTPDDYQKYDMILCMEQSNINSLMQIIDSDPDNKISLLLDHTDRPHDIADPWYTRDFRAAWKDIYAGVKAVFDSLLPQAKADLASSAAHDTAD